MHQVNTTHNFIHGVCHYIITIWGIFVIQYVLNTSVIIQLWVTSFFSIDSFYMDRTLHSSNHFHHHGHVFMFNYMHKMFSLVWFGFWDLLHWIDVLVIHMSTYSLMLKKFINIKTQLTLIWDALIGREKGKVTITCIYYLRTYFKHFTDNMIFKSI